MPPDNDIAPPRSRQRWFVCIEYGEGLKIELPSDGEQDALRAGIDHYRRDRRGIAKVGYYGFRARVIVHGEAELREFARQCG